MSSLALHVVECTLHLVFESHSFRHNLYFLMFTRALSAGVDLRTVQQWMGHTDVESTMRYLKPNRSQVVHEKVNLMFD